MISVRVLLNFKTNNHVHVMKQIENCIYYIIKNINEQNFSVYKLLNNFGR